MKIRVGKKLYDCNLMARTVVRFWRDWGFSFSEEWYKDIRAFNPDDDRHRELLMQLAYTAIGAPMSYKAFCQKVLDDKDFFVTANAVRFLVFECRMTPDGKKIPNYGIPNDELTFLAQVAIARIPDAWLDELKYYQIVQLIQRIGMLQSPDTYKTEIMDGEELDKFHGLTDERKRKISEYLQKQMSGEQ